MYKLTSGTSILRTTDGATIPADSANADYQAYLAWRNAGNTPLPADVPTLTQNKAAAANKIRTDASDIIRDTILHFPIEYQTAKKQADDFKAAGYPALSVPPMVKAWADAKGWTATDAANDIIAAGNGWLSAQDSIRTNRLKHAEQAKAAVDQAALDSCMASWESFRKTMRANLGI